jgi:hypothetical protein
MALWPDGVKFHLLSVTYAQLHRKIDAEGLAVSYCKIIYVVCETINVLYISLDI